MGVGLQPLEFSDCAADSPYFRVNLHAHEKELDKTNQQIKRLIKEVKDLMSAAKHLSRAQRTLSSSLQDFSFESIGTTQTDDELVITKSLGEFGRLIATIEDERDRMLDRAYDQIILPLENFRKDHIGGVKVRLVRRVFTSMLTLYLSWDNTLCSVREYLLQKYF
uniref:Rho GTPase-activating protein 26 n=1 Tax=Cacopsylla melanoneura TaxID=428564 RepID=A0A8D9E2L9_9HEMI